MASVKELAKKWVGNWKEFKGLGWEGAYKLEDPENWAVYCTHTRDSPTREVSRGHRVEAALGTFLVKDKDPDARLERFRHWGCGWIDAVSVRVYRDGAITKAFKKLVPFLRRES